MKHEFSYYIQDYFSNYLPIVRNLSENTIETYKYSFLVFSTFLKSKKKNMDILKLEDITCEIIEEFIKWLKNERNNSSKTINIRINSIKSFFSYIETKELNMYDICAKVKNIKQLKTKKHIPKYFTTDEMREILNVIDVNEKNGLRDLIILSLIYDAALRVSELCHLKIDDLIFNSQKQPYIFVSRGKGDKERSVPISKDVANYLKKYINENEKLKEYLFLNRYGQPYTRKGIDYIIDKYYKKTKQKESKREISRNESSPHMFRHSKAVHMMDSDINIVVIRDYLGHSSVQSTEIYARISQSKQDEIILEHAKNLKINNKIQTKEKETFDEWIRKNLKN